MELKNLIKMMDRYGLYSEFLGATSIVKIGEVRLSDEIGGEGV